MRLYKKNILIPLAFSVTACSLFSLIFILKVGTDLQAHIELFKKFQAAGSYPFPFLYYFLLHAISELIWFLNSSFQISAVIILTAASIFKYYLSASYLKKNILINDNHQALFLQILVFMLMFFFPLILNPLDGARWYFGKFTPTIWHNSTSIFAFPIGLLLFMVTASNISNLSSKTIFTIIFLTMLLAISKPSYLFGYIPGLVLSILLINRFRIDKSFLKVLLISLTGVSIILVSKFFIYEFSKLDEVLYADNESGVIIAPFQVWLIWARQPLLSLISSVFIFGVSFGGWGKKLIKDVDVVFSGIVFLCSVLVFFILAESGPRMTHMNFYWQIPVSMFCLILAITKNLYEALYFKGVDDFWAKSFKDKLLILTYFSYFFCGVLYIVKVLVFKHYG